MDLKPLRFSGEMTPEAFTEHFRGILGANFDRALAVFAVFYEFHAFSVASVLHCAIQKGIVDEVLGKLEAWRDKVLAATTTDELIHAHAGVKFAIDAIYGSFMATGDTIDGLGPFEPMERRGGFVTYGMKGTSSRRRDPQRIILPDE